MRRLDAGLGIADLERFPEREKPGRGGREIQRPDALEHFIGPRTADHIFERMHDNAVVDADSEARHDEKRTKPEAAKDRAEDSPEKEKRPPKVETRQDRQDPVRHGMDGGAVDEKKKLLIHAGRRVACGMIFRSRQFRKLLALFGTVLFALSARAEPDAAAILTAARMNPLGANLALDARLRTGPDQTPFRIVVDGSIHYQFTDPEQELILELKDDGSELSERTGGKTASVRRARFDDPVRGTGITYEDLALKFLYWNNPKILGEETLRSRRAWKIELQSGRESSQYGIARLWIDQETGALLRIEGYNREGRLLRRFEVVSAQKLDGQWMLKQMRIETLDPVPGKVVNRTYLEVLGKARPGAG